jgi:hypothetical protein
LSFFFFNTLHYGVEHFLCWFGLACFFAFFHSPCAV